MFIINHKKKSRKTNNLKSKNKLFSTKNKKNKHPLRVGTEIHNLK